MPSGWDTPCKSVRPTRLNWLGAGPNQCLAACRAERPAAAQKEDRLEQAGLARGVLAGDQVAAAVEFQLRPLDAPEVLDCEPLEAHRVAAMVSPPRSEAHRHDDEARACVGAGPDQAAAVSVREADLDLRSIDGRQRIQEVIDVEANVELRAVVDDLELFLRFFLLRVVRLDDERIRPSPRSGCRDTSRSKGSLHAAAPGAVPRDPPSPRGLGCSESRGRTPGIVRQSASK